MHRLQGHLLVAMPYLLDPNFHKTVVLIVEHGDSGALGLVLNRPAETLIKEIWDKVSESACNSEQPLYVGGPVQGPIMAIHKHESLSESTVLPGVHFSVHKDHLNEIVAGDDAAFRLFVGHAGWAAGQLESELEAGSWLTAPAKFEHVFAEPTELWDLLRKEIADTSLLGGLKVKHVPPNTSMN